MGWQYFIPLDSLGMKLYPCHFWLLEVTTFFDFCPCITSAFIASITSSEPTLRLLHLSNKGSYDCIQLTWIIQDYFKILNLITLAMSLLTYKEIDSQFFMIGNDSFGEVLILLTKTIVLIMLFFLLLPTPYLFSIFEEEGKVLVAQSCPTLCDPTVCTLPGSSFHGICQARILAWVAISFSRGSSQPRDQTQVSCIAGKRFFTICATRKAFTSLCICYILICCDPLYSKLQKGRDFCLILASVNSRDLEPCWKHSNASIHYIIILYLKPQSV